MGQGIRTEREPLSMANRIRFTTAAQVVEAFPGAASEMGEVPADVSPLDYLAALAAADNSNAAVIFAALALPKRESVWWGCITLRGMGKLDDRAREGLRLAEAWIRHPEEDERRAAGVYAESQYFEGAGAWIAFAAFTTSGSLAPAGLQAVPPSPEISGKCVAMAVLQATNDPDAFVRLKNLRAALESARDLASGGDGTGPWKRRAEELAATAVRAG
jgi:hypothetical protein